MIKLIVFILLSSLTTNLFGQKSLVNSNFNEKLLSVCKENAEYLLTKKVDSLFAGANDSVQKTRKLTQIEYYKAKILLVDRRLKSITAKNMNKANDFTKVAFDEYRKSIPDLPESFYSKSLYDIKKL